VLGEAPWHRERLGERLQQEVSEVERGTYDDAAVVKLPSDQAPAVPPVEQALAASFGDAVELSGQAAEIGEPHQVMLTSPSNMCSGDDFQRRTRLGPAFGNFP